MHGNQWVNAFPVNCCFANPPDRKQTVRIVVILILVAIFASLFSALYFLFKDNSGSTRTVKALTSRVALSLGLFLLLMAAHYFGLIGHRL